MNANHTLTPPDHTTRSARMSCITVKTQAEIDAAIADSGTTCVHVESPEGVWVTIADENPDRRYRVTGSATVERVTGSATVKWVTGSATVKWVDGSATVERVDGSATVKWVTGSATVEWVTGSATVEWVTGSATVERVDGSATVKWVDGSATVKWVTGSATVKRVTGSATVKWVTGSATVERVDGSATVKRVTGTAVLHHVDGRAQILHAGSHVSVYLYSGQASVTGGRVVDLTQINLHDPRTWCEHHGVEIRGDGKAVLYKAVDDDLTAGRDWDCPTVYTVGAEVSCDDWRADNGCGGGLHVSPHPMYAREYNGAAARYLRVLVDAAGLRPINDGGPPKCKVPRCWVEAEVDQWADEMAAAPAEAVKQGHRPVTT